MCGKSIVKILRILGRICGKITHMIVLIKKENTTMKERVLKAVFVAISIAFGITLVTFINGEEFSFVKPALYAIIASIVDFIFSFLFDKKKK